MKAALAALALAALAGCATVPAQAPTCLPLRSYTPQQQQALAAALGALAADSPLIDAFTDYAAMRDATRACRASHT